MAVFQFNSRDGIKFMISTKNKEASQQIMHEAEITRQYARYKIPAKIEIDSVKYTLLDWSISGCAIEGLPQKYCDENICRNAKVIFKFDDFITIVDNVSLDFICSERKGSESTIAGGRFQNLNAAQIAIFNQIITAYLSGDILTEDDILHAVTKQITYPKKIEKKIDRKKADKLLIVIYLTLFILVSFLLFVAYQRIFIVQTLNAYVDTNLTAIRSPYPSYIKFTQKLTKGDNVDVNETIALAYFVGGGVQAIHPPVQGTVYKVNVLDKQFRNTAEPICMIIPKNAKTYIVAHLDHKKFQKISLGDIAKVWLNNGQIIEAKITAIKPAESLSLGHAKVLANIYNQARSYDTIILEPLKALSADLLNTTVFVTIDTLLQ